jgi:septal ring factor EnvC (AmiA/AmiB activator)
MLSIMKELKDRQITLSIGTASVLVVFMAGVIYSSSIRINNIENTLNLCKDTMVKNAQDIDSTQKVLQQNDVTNAEIKTKLVNIEATLQEIKQQLSH